MVVGLLLVVAGGYLALSGRLAWSLPAFAVGFGIVLTLIRGQSPLQARQPDHAADASSWLEHGANVGLFAGILIVGNVLTFRLGGMASTALARGPSASLRGR